MEPRIDLRRLRAFGKGAKAGCGGGLCSQHPFLCLRDYCSGVNCTKSDGNDGITQVVFSAETVGICIFDKK